LWSIMSSILHPCPLLLFLLCLFFFNDPPTTEIYTLSLHDALPISTRASSAVRRSACSSNATPKYPDATSFSSFSCADDAPSLPRSEEHTSELQSPCNLVCRLLLEKKKKNKHIDLYSYIEIIDSRHV